MKIGLKIRLLWMYINVSIDLLYKKITSMIAYFAAKYHMVPNILEFRQYLVYHENIGLENFSSPCILCMSLFKYFKPWPV